MSGKFGLTFEILIKVFFIFVYYDLFSMKFNLTLEVLFVFMFNRVETIALIIK